MTIPELKQDIIFQTQLLGKPLTLHSTWGLFSPKAIDEGTLLLLNHLKLPAGARVLDLGCGYGPLGLAVAAADPSSRVELVDKDFLAIEYTRKNAELNHLANTSAYLSNGFSAVPENATYDAVISNVPAKIGTELLQIFLHDAYDHLNPGGQLYVVTISGLRDYMKRHLTEVFGNYDKLKQSKTYTAARAIKPNRPDHV
jgi:16S rRNA (guanine1207-N2)-methyltransferase